jgi:hypothetical protein
MDSIFTLPFSAFGNKVPFPITVLFQFMRHNKQEITESELTQLQDDDETKVAKVIESLSKGIKPSKKMMVSQGVIGAVIKEYFEKKEEKVIDDQTLEKLIAAAKEEYRKEAFQEALTSLSPTNLAILAYICIFARANKKIISGTVASNFFTPILSNGKETDEFMVTLIQHSDEIFEEIDKKNLKCTQDDLACIIQPVYDEEYVNIMRKRIAKRNNSRIPGASCDVAVQQELVRPRGRPQEFESIDHDYEYGEGKEDDEDEEGTLDYKYIEVNGSDYEYEYEYEIDE